MTVQLINGLPFSTSSEKSSDEVNKINTKETKQKEPSGFVIDDSRLSIDFKKIV